MVRRFFKFLAILAKDALMGVLVFLIILTSTGWIPQIKTPLAPKTALATYQFDPNGGAIVTGSNPAILGATAAAAEGVNLGSWLGARSDDNLHFGVTSTTSGFNAYLDVGDAQLNGANKLIVQTEFDLDATVPTTLVQICDWVSSTGVHNAADAQCTTGGWRNLNLNDVGITTATATSYDWEIYDGYWNTSATGKISTPLTNFVDGSNTIRIRYFSTTNTTSIINIDFLRVYAVVNPVYSASGASQITGGTPLGDYSLATIGGAGQTGSDNAYFRVPGTAGAVSDFYMSFTGVETYTGANTILVRAEYSCSATGINHRPKIYNFNTSSWEDLTTASIACSATDATNAWAKNNVTISDYISNGEIRVGWRGLANGTQEIRLDYMYIMIGTTNTDGASEITFGSNSANSVTNTRDLDMTGTSNTWSILSADESNTQSFAQNGYDSDNDATVEEASAANFHMNVTAPDSTAVTGVFFAGRFMSGAAGTVQMGVRDYSGLTSATGGWTAVGGTSTTAQTYTDNLTVASVASGGAAGMSTNPEDHIDTVDNNMNVRLRTTVSGATTNNSVAQWDFAMVSLQWTETGTGAPPGGSLTFSLSDNSVGFGNLGSGAARYATGDTNGSASDTADAHTISASTNATDGYTITISGNTLTSGVNTIAAIGNAAAASSAGTEQYGLRLIVNSGTGTAASPYNGSNWALDAAAFPDVVASGSGDSATTVFGVRYIGNISANTDAGVYTSTLTYTITATY